MNTSTAAGSAAETPSSSIAISSRSIPAPKPTPGVGFGAGIERLLIAMEEEGVAGTEPAAVDVFIARETDAPRELVPALLKTLRDGGLAADTDYAGRSLKGQLTQAGRSGARTTVILRAQDALIRAQGAQDEAVAHAEVVGRILR